MISILFPVFDLFSLYWFITFLQRYTSVSFICRPHIQISIYSSQLYVYMLKLTELCKSIKLSFFFYLKIIDSNIRVRYIASCLCNRNDIVSVLSAQKKQYCECFVCSTETILLVFCLLNRNDIVSFLVCSTETIL